MKKIIVWLVMLGCLCVPLSGYSQYTYFEHRYEYKLSDVLDASKFIEKKNYWEGYKDNKLVGYVLLSNKWTEKLVGYSGKHMETLIGMDTKGVLTGIKLLYHSEPIVLIGLKEKNYQDFLKQYNGRNIKQDVSIGKEMSMDAITGATVTAIVHNAIIFGSARKVASESGMMQFAHKAERKISAKFTPMSWKELLSSGAVKNIKVSSKEIGIDDGTTYLDLYFGVITPPSIGRNVLGDTAYSEVMKSLKKGETALFVVSMGSGSFKGSGFARGGMFDRFNIEQDARVYVFRDKDYRILTDVVVKDAPDIKEGGIFTVSSDDFDPTNPLKFNLMIPYRTGTKKDFKSYSLEYSIPDKFLE